VGDLERYRVCEGHFRDWLHHGLTGCYFASSLAAKHPVRIDFYSPLGKLHHGQIAAFIDGAASREMTAVLLFPRLRTSRDIGQLLGKLAKGPRWRVSRVRWPKGCGKADSYALSLEWMTKAGPVCDAMGLAHVGTMPVTRRSPYVAIVVWGGPHLNKYLPQGPRVGVASAPTGLKKKAAHSKLMKQSDERVRMLLGVRPAEDRVWLRRVAFILPKAAAVQVLSAAASVKGAAKKKAPTKGP